MQCDAELFLSERLLAQIEDKAVEQIVNVASLPFAEKVCAMPDMHSGYGFPIGGVAAFDAINGIVSPGGIGFDINCGVKSFIIKASPEELKKALSKKVIEKIKKNIPAGLGSESKRIDKDSLYEVITKGLDFAIKEGIADKDDKLSCEDYGTLKSDALSIPQKAESIALKQAGTLGSGNHFLEIQSIDKIYNKDIAEKWGIEEDFCIVMIHSGSRAFGYKIAEHYIDLFSKKNKEVIDPNLIYAEINTDEAQLYLDAMRAAANYAYYNRQLMSYHLKMALKDFEFKALYDVAHNIAKEEYYKINNKRKKYLVHRKGATRAFSKNNDLLPEKYKKTGQPAIVPGSMGTFSYILIGREAEKISLGSVSHGAGRVLSRSKAKKILDKESIIKDLYDKGIKLISHSQKAVLEEAPQAYKDVNEVINVLQENNIAEAVIRLKPIFVLKG